MRAAENSGRPATAVLTPNSASPAQMASANHDCPEYQIVGVPHLAHAALADARDHPIAPGKHLAGGKPGGGAIGQGCRGGAAA